MSSNGFGRRWFVAVLSLAESNQQPVRPVLVLACGCCRWNQEDFIAGDGEQLNLANGLPEWLTNVETALYIIVAAKKCSQEYLVADAPASATCRR